MGQSTGKTPHFMRQRDLRSPSKSNARALSAIGVPRASDFDAVFSQQKRHSQNSIGRNDSDNALNPVPTIVCPQNGTGGRGGGRSIGRYIPYPRFPLCFLVPAKKSGGPTHIGSLLQFNGEAMGEARNRVPVFEKMPHRSTQTSVPAQVQF